MTLLQFTTALAAALLPVALVFLRLFSPEAMRRRARVRRRSARAAATRDRLRRTAELERAL